jgi:hypothetical protein
VSFEAQERALFALLFDAELRARFVADRTAALAAFELSDEERADLAEIRPDALELDATLRRDLILQKTCRALPLSFSLASSLPGGLDAARALVDTAWLAAPPARRTLGFARRLREALAAAPVGEARDHALVLAMIDAEVALTALTTARREDASTPDEAPAPARWWERPLRLAPHVCAVLVPQSYQALVRALCPGSLDELWARLSATPLPASLRQRALADERPGLLVARAEVVRRSRCETTVDRRLVELAGGFAQLLPHLDGRASVEHLLAELRRAGATGPVLAGVREGFAQLVAQGMLVAA